MSESEAGSGSDSGRRWWLAGAAVAGLAAVVLVVALAVPWNGTVSEEASAPSGELSLRAHGRIWRLLPETRWGLPAPGRRRR